jgi:hypothetical protein
VSTTTILDQMSAHVEARMNELRGLPYVDLAKLPEILTQEMHVGGMPVAVTVFLRVHPPSQLLVVVQAYRRRFFGIMGQVIAKGFVASENGDRLDAPEKVLWEFT